MWRSLTLAVALCAALSPALQAATVTSDGIGGLTEPAPGAVDVTALADALATDADFGAALAAARGLRDAAPRTALPRQLLAAAQAASGDGAAAQATLDGIAVTAARVPAGEGWERIARALLARQQGMQDAAAVHARRAIDAAPDNAYARNVAGSIAVQAGDLAAAADHFTAAVDRAPDAVTYRANLGAALVALRQYDQADTVLSAVLRQAPDNCTALVAAGAMLRSTRQPAAAAEAFAQCLAAQPAQPVAALQLVEIHLERGAPDTAALVVDRHAAAFDDPQFMLGVIAIHNSDGAAAVRHLDAAINRNGAALNMTLAQALEGRFADGAARAADVARMGAPAAWSIHAGLAAAASIPPATDMPANTPSAGAFAALADPGAAGPVAQVAAAAGEIVTGVRLDGATEADLAAFATGPARSAVILGLVLEGTGFPTAARTAYGRAVEQAPGAALPLALLAHASEGVDPEAAIAHNEAALALSPTLWLANRRLGTLYARQGMFAKATGLLAAAAAARPDDGTLLLLGLAAERNDDIPVAIDAYERLVAAAPDDALALNQYAWLLVRKTDDLDRALALATKADALSPGNATILDTLGWVKFRLGDVAGSLRALRAAYGELGAAVFEPAVGLVRDAVEAGDPAAARAVLAHLDAVAGGQATGEAIDAARALVDG